MSGNPLDKYRDTRTPVSSSIAGCGWIELKHQIVFLGDNGKIIPAAGVRYQLRPNQGLLIQGVLDQNGCAQHDNIGPGPVNIVYAPYVDTEKQIILKEIKRVMDEFIAQEREEKARITEQTKNETDLEADWGALKSIGRAGYTVAVNAAEFFNYVVWGAAKEGFHLIQYLTPITAPAAYEKDVTRFKNTYKALKEFTDEDLKILYTVMEDPESRQLFTQFASDYLDAQHGLEITEGTAEVVFSVILAFATASGGAAVAAGHGGEKLAELGSKLADPIQRLIVVIKQALAKKRVKGESNRLVESEVEIGDNSLSDPDFIGTSNGDVAEVKSLTPNKRKGVERELRVTEIVNGKLATQSRIRERDGKLIVEDIPVVRDGKVVTGIDVIGKNGELIQVGGPGKNANDVVFEKTKRSLQALKDEAELKGTKAQVFYEQGKSDRFNELIRESKRILGDDNVFILP